MIMGYLFWIIVVLCITVYSCIKFCIEHVEKLKEKTTKSGTLWTCPSCKKKYLLNTSSHISIEHSIATKEYEGD